MFGVDVNMVGKVGHMIDYNKYVTPYEHNFIPIEVPYADLDRLKRNMSKYVGYKVKEYSCDGLNIRKRYFTGYLGELAVSHFLGEDFMDWTVGRSKSYVHADLSRIGLDIGIKTVEYGRFPVVHRCVERPEIINIKVGFNKVLICGLALEGVLRCYRDDDLILSPELRRKGTKTGFYGLHKLLPFRSVNDLYKILGLNREVCKYV